MQASKTGALGGSILLHWQLLKVCTGKALNKYIHMLKVGTPKDHSGSRVDRPGIDAEHVKHTANIEGGHSQRVNLITLA